jgi:hypothetical protein
VAVTQKNAGATATLWKVVQDWLHYDICHGRSTGTANRVSPFIEASIPHVLSRRRMCHMLLALSNISL